MECCISAVHSVLRILISPAHLAVRLPYPTLRGPECATLVIADTLLGTLAQDRVLCLENRVRRAGCLPSFETCAGSLVMPKTA